MNAQILKPVYQMNGRCEYPINASLPSFACVEFGFKSLLDDPHHLYLPTSAIRELNLPPL
jgi:hypothetical protein